MNSGKKRLILLLVVVALTLGFGPIGYAAPWNPEELMAVEELHPEMKGVGKTVFSGTRVEEFGVEILAVLKNVRPGGDLILARLSGGPLEHAGVIGGMSGSPVYIGGKLIGAVAYGWSFAKEPIAGITPIGEMLELLEGGGAETPEGLTLEYPNKEDDKPLFSDIRVPGESLVGRSIRGSLSLTPIWTPLTLSGFDERVVELMTPTLEKWGMIPILGGSAVEGVGPDSLVPGAAIGVQLVRGDASASAIGTLTYRKGGRVIAFGHPMFFAGPIDLPLTGAYVHSILPSQVSSFKFASPTQPMGKVDQDRRAGVAGIINPKALPQLIPMHIRLTTGDQIKDYQFEVVEHKLFSPFFVGWTMLNTILTSGRKLGECTLKLHMRIELGDRSAITREDLFSGPSVPLRVTDAVSGPVQLLMDNEFEPVNIEGISLDIHIDERRRTANIEGIRVNRVRVRPGEEVELEVLLKPYHEGTIIEKVSLKIPRDVPEGQVQLRVGDALSAQAWEVARLPLEYKPQNLDQLIDHLEKKESNNQIVVELFLPRQGAMVQGRELPCPPPSILSVIRPHKQTGEVYLTEGISLLRQRLFTNYVVRGSETLNLIIIRE